MKRTVTQPLAEVSNAVEALFGRMPALISAKLGRCAKCWRSSLRLAVAGWLVAAAAYVLGPTILQPVILLWPLAFTALWLAHVVTYTIRVVAWERAQRDEWRAARGDRRAEHLSPARPLTRGRMIGAVAKSVLIMVAASASVPFFTGKALADSCDCTDKLTCCKKPVATKCCFNPARQEYFCVPPGSTCCGSPYLSWHCEGQTPNCNGDGRSSPYCY